MAEQDSSDEWTELQKSIIKQGKIIKQDTLWHAQQQSKTQAVDLKQQAEQKEAAFYFSDHYEPLLKQDPISYLKENADANELKKLKKGFYEPELFLDLHGLTQKEAKQEIAALIQACLAENVHCALIMYGHGKHILKTQTPMWLVQHPSVIALYQAPNALGGNAAVLVLFEVNDDFNQFKT